MLVAAIQHDIDWKDWSSTHRRVAPMIDAAAVQGARLIVLSEMFSTGFSMNAAEIAQPMDGPSVTFLRESAASTGSWIAASVAVTPDDGGRARNRFVAAGPTDEIKFYDKRHPFTYAGEDREFDRGDEVVSFEIETVRVTPFICYDLRFADDFWRQGPTSDLFVVPANWPAARREHWMALLSARAIENQCYVMGVNRVGTADGLLYSGDSRIVSPTGELLGTASIGEAVIVAEVSSEIVVETRSAFPFLQDRR